MSESNRTIIKAGSSLGPFEFIDNHSGEIRNFTNFLHLNFRHVLTLSGMTEHDELQNINYEVHNMKILKGLAPQR